MLDQNFMHLELNFNERLLPPVARPLPPFCNFATFAKFCIRLFPVFIDERRRRIVGVAERKARKSIGFDYLFGPVATDQHPNLTLSN